MKQAIENMKGNTDKRRNAATLIDTITQRIRTVLHAKQVEAATAVEDFNTFGQQEADAFKNLTAVGDAMVSELKAAIVKDEKTGAYTIKNPDAILERVALMGASASEAYKTVHAKFVESMKTMVYVRDERAKAFDAIATELSEGSASLIDALAEEKKAA